MRICAIAIFCLLLGLSACNEADRTEVAETRSPLADSLIVVFEGLRSAAAEHDLSAFLELVDSSSGRELVRLSRRHGFRSLESYLREQYGRWPDLDTLRVDDLLTTDQYARLTMLGDGMSERYGEARDRYTVLLYRRDGDRWRLLDMTMFERRRYDEYGHEMSWHEVDLPPDMRFPRQF